MKRTISFPLPEKISVNQAMRMHFRMWARKVEEYHTQVNYFIGGIEPIESYPVEITYNFSFLSKPLDTSNCAFMVKVIEDALVRKGILKNDDPCFVMCTHITSRKHSDKSVGDHVEIIIQKK